MFRTQSIRRKVTQAILTACLVSLVLSTIGMAGFEFSVFRQRAKDALFDHAGMIAASVYSAVDFRQPRVAEEVLGALRSAHDIVEARVFTMDGQPFAAYLRTPGKSGPPPAPGTDGFRTESGHLVLVQTLVRDGDPFARLYLRSNLQGARRQLVEALVVIGGLLLALIGIAAALSWLLQRSITRPVTRLAGVMRAVTERKDYGLRAERLADDEIGRLAGSFNDMLSTVQQQDAALRSSEAFMDLLIGSAGDAILLYDLGGRIVRVNEQACASLGYAAEQLKTMHRWQIEPTAGGEEQVRAQAEKLEAGGHLTIEGGHRRADGTTFPVEIRLSRMDASSGAFVIAFARDVSERRRMEEQLRQSQKLEAIGQLAGGIAHDFNNIMTVIMGHVSMLHEEAVPGTASADSLGEVLDASRRASALTRQLLAYSRRQLMRAGALNLNDTVRDTIRMLTRLIGEHIRIECRYGDGVPLIRADGGMIGQVIVNLAVNARDAMPRGGTLAISTSEEDVPPDRVALNSESRAGTFACLTVCDTGCGMDADTQRHIFEPFFTTKGVGQGTGLGLASVYGIVKQHEGWIEVASEPGRGTTFRVYLPAGLPEPAVEQVTIDRPPLSGGTETVLLVEDEAPVRKLAGEMLRRHGYRVFEAGSAIQALNVWREQRGGFDLLLTDIVMPGGMSGLELAKQTRAERPELRVICCSGYSEDFRRPEDADDFEFLPKPYTADDLMRAVRQCLDGSGRAGRAVR